MVTKDTTPMNQRRDPMNCMLTCMVFIHLTQFATNFIRELESNNLEHAEFID